MKRWRIVRRFAGDDRAVAGIEAAFLFPLMLILLCGAIDTGVALLVNQKLVTSAQTVADILAREDDVSDTEFDDAVAAGRLSLMPYTTAGFGVDVAGIQYVGAGAVATVIWRDTVDTTENAEILDGAEGLGLQNEGVLGVTARYTHTPYFSGIFTGDFTMQEVAYVRGRRGLFVTRTRG